ncbi:hypothetical protein [Haloferula sp.]|uniref:hypothetical protein n=1 Tax=Haloferula sp. TaxID=2497595 RepID=UPI00329AD3CC
MPRFFHRLILLPVVLLLSACAVTSKDGWKAAVEVQTAQLGYRNWIVVAEASFPAHNKPGTRQVNAYESIPVVLDEVLRILEKTEHVRPRIYTPREMRSVENDFAPGIDEHRRVLDGALHGHVVTELDQDSLLTLVQDAQKSFDVLVIRTTTALPYSSVFLELQPGYWDGESEQRLRSEMQRKRMEKLASPTP